MIDPDVQRRIETMAEQAQRFAAGMRDLNGEGADDAGLVRAVCAPGGRLVDLQFSPEAHYTSTDALREAILAAAQRASDAATSGLNSMVADMAAGAGGFGADALAQVQDQVVAYQRLVREQQERVEDLQRGLHRP
ncbi:YbaB/EbfC family nucleoid-associated protein [Catenuloplanes japonicus]|uniref:YbaB/EbfC family nucleoid-associated protein n=1 Tax=Catenuloplanes japonicus TaxID=33876 RepID=UPI000525574C|nr:YbaB/EbfC family nucleoid-associated protein [Catenuloplanes japonicus]